MKSNSGGGGWSNSADHAAAGYMVASPITASYGKQVDSSDTSKGPPNLLAVARALRAEGHDASEDGTGRGVPLVAQPLRSGRQYSDMGDGQANVIPDVSPALKQRDHKGPSSDGDGDGAPLIPVAFNLRGREGGAMPELDDKASVRAASGGSSRSYVAAMGVRRLTPRECERLQGFPDDYTLIPYRGKAAADGPRYKALGNSMAVPCMRWLAERIAAVEAMVRANFTEGA